MERTPTNKHYPPQFSLILRILCGGYLLYLAWGLRGSFFQGDNGTLFGLAVILFVVVGALLCFFSIRALIRGEYRLPYESDDDDKDDGTHGTGERGN